MQQLGDENDPCFVYEMAALFFNSVPTQIDELSKNLKQQVVDYKNIDVHVHTLKGASATFGAQRMINVCIDFLKYCCANDLQGCLKCMQQLNQEFLELKIKVEALFKVEKQIVAAGGSVPIVACKNT
ncbi:hypothetical protein LUZ62_040249 [Rhynchospora pubera]|uniref:Histidine-containing phosphotransfer protein n=1 Tax=Rhynchospora pubera TaxID=906938 RepID=A0AAV8FDS2_9POAL|nr:hypothetical protein LUZ62_040249 [Rhynchospora pubera]